MNHQVQINLVLEKGILTETEFTSYANIQNVVQRWATLYDLASPGDGQSHRIEIYCCVNPFPE